jgi:transcriptional regulator with XRE-family HTH domain
MTPTRLRECLTALHWSQRGLADVLTYSEGTVRGWARGAREIPEAVAVWLEELAAVHEARPLPTGWDRGETRSDAAA